MADKDYNRIAAVQKACDVLRELAASREPLGGNEVAERVHLSPGTVMCHLATLEKRGYVEQMGDGWVLASRPAHLWARGHIGKFTPPTGKTYRTIASVETAIDILEFLGSNGVSNLQDVATAVDRSPSGAGSQLETLVDAGFVMEMGNHYKLGMRLSVLWARVRSNLEARLAKVNKELEQLTIKEAA